MKIRPRPWQLALGLILLCTLIAVVALYWKRTFSLSTKELVALFPKENGAVFYVDLGLIRKSGVLDRVSTAAVAEEEDYRRFVEQTGFDYKTDLNELAAFYAKDEYLFALTGNFDWKRLIAYAKQQGGRCQNGLCRAPTSKRGRWFSFYALNEHVMAAAISNDEAAAARVRRRDPDPSLTVPSSPVWMSVPAFMLQNNEALPSGARQFAKLLSANAERLLMSVGLSSDRFELQVDVTCKTAEQAAVLRTDLQNLTTLLQSFIAREKQKPNPGDLSGVLTAGTFHREDRHVIARWPMDMAFLENLTAMGSP
ncbi:MAG TPA: hypothetical protein VE621_00910 [Bryobacteraceae bacterium]|nr:hypothetical protein [Bryobacteraceae bacterium]